MVRSVAVRAEVSRGIDWYAGVLARRLGTASFATMTCSGEAIDVGRAGFLSGTCHTLLLIWEEHSGRIAPTDHLRYALMRTHADTTIVLVETAHDLRCGGQPCPVLQVV